MIDGICLCSSLVDPHVHREPGDLGQPLGWVVKDPAGNVIESGPVSIALPASAVGETQSAEGDE
jgi:hypothetical protein